MRWFVLVALAGGCSQDAPPVTDPDAAPVADAGPDAGCGDTYAGKLLDWDADTGVAGATLTVRTDATRTGTVAADGAFSLCIPDGNFAVVDVTNTGDYLPGLAFAKNDVVRRTMASLRTMTAAQRDAAFAMLGQTFDPNAAQLVVHFNAPHKATINSSSAGTLARNAGAWAAGDTGDYVFFANVALGATANTLVSSDAAGVVGTATVPLAPGTISFVELFVP